MNRILHSSDGNDNDRDDAYDGDNRGTTYSCSDGVQRPVSGGHSGRHSGHSRQRSRSKSISSTVSWDNPTAMAEASCQQSLAKVGRLRRELQEGEPQLQVAEDELEALGPPGKTSVPRCMMHRCGYCGVRVGEAAHPGPTSAGSMDADSRPTRARPGSACCSNIAMNITYFCL